MEFKNTSLDYMVFAMVSDLLSNTSAMSTNFAHVSLSMHLLPKTYVTKKARAFHWHGVTDTCKKRAL